MSSLSEEEEPVKLQPNRDYVERTIDERMTPPSFAKKIVDHFRPQFGEGDTFLEPCRGEGAFYDVLPSPKDWCEIEEGRDFLEFKGHVSWVITNPPWSKIREFLVKGFEVADHVVYLFTINHVWTKARLRLAREAGFTIDEILLTPFPRVFSPTGFQLGVVHYRRGGDLGCMKFNLTELSWKDTVRGCS